MTMNHKILYSSGNIKQLGNALCFCSPKGEKEEKVLIRRNIMINMVINPFILEQILK